MNDDESYGLVKIAEDNEGTPAEYGTNINYPGLNNESDKIFWVKIERDTINSLLNNIIFKLIITVE
ncbi:hypothetical protein D3C75_1347110 [compost metagenome]